MALVLLALAATILGAAAQSAFTTCNCTGTPEQQWSLPSSAPAPISSKRDPTMCWQLAKTVGALTCDGLCVHLGPCSSPDTPTWTISSKGSFDLIQVASAGPAQGWCLDENTARYYVQVYQCIGGDTHQTWAITNSAVVELWDGADGCVAEPGSSCKQPVPPGSQYCPQYHVVQGTNVYDPSGPLLTPTGDWHVWEDDGAWSHYMSRDLLRWKLLQPTTGFTGLTGSISITPSGAYAFWPDNSQSCIASAASQDAQFMGWTQRGSAFCAPPMAGQNFRDPARAFEYGGAWYVGVGCNNQSKSADLCIYRALDNTLSTFEFEGSMFTVTSTYGQMNGDIVWVNKSVAATMMECPDVFPIGPDGLWMVIGSLFSTNQWWIGRVQGSLPRFVPQAVGLLDYGNGYAVKTGSTFQALPTDRRVQFAFTGWSEPTKVPACGRAFILPRDITLVDGTPRFNPIPETATLRSTAAGAHLSASDVGDGGAALVSGSQVQLNGVCSMGSSNYAGKVFFRVLGSPDGNQFTEIGYDFSKEALYVNHSSCCTQPNTIVQFAPLPAATLAKERLLNITIFVDGGLIETFLGGFVAITTLVDPTYTIDPAVRRNTFVNGGSGLSCSALSWQLIGLPKP